MYMYVMSGQVYKASRPGSVLRVYFLLYDSSVEEQVSQTKWQAGILKKLHKGTCTM